MLIVDAPPLMKREVVARSVRPSASVYCSGRLKLPFSLGVPPSVRPLSDRPAGSDAPATVYEPLPPITRNACEYAVPRVPFCRNPVWRSGETVIGNVFVALIPPASVTVNCTLNVPATVGVPHSSASPGVTDERVSPLPPNRMLMPDGRPEAVQANGPVPPFLT